MEETVIESEFGSLAMFRNKIFFKTKILEALKQKELTVPGIKEYLQNQHGLIPSDLDGQVSRLEEAYFVERREEDVYRLSNRGQNILEDYLKYEIGPDWWGMKNFIRWQVLEKAGISTTTLIDNYGSMFGLSRKGKSKTDKKRKIISEIESEIKTEMEFFHGGLDYKPPRK
jgi:hypothetical protein